MASEWPGELKGVVDVTPDGCQPSPERERMHPWCRPFDLGQSWYGPLTPQPGPEIRVLVPKQLHADASKPPFPNLLTRDRQRVRRTPHHKLSPPSAHQRRPLMKRYAPSKPSPLVCVIPVQEVEGFLSRTQTGLSKTASSCSSATSSAPGQSGCATLQQCALAPKESTSWCR